MKTSLNKKILLLTENFPPKSGGSGRWFWELYSRLPANKIVIATNYDNKASEFDQTCPMPIERLTLSSPEWGFRSIAGLRFYFSTVLALRKIVKNHEIDEIHCGRVIHEGVTAWLLSLVTRIKYICYVHGEDVETAATSGEHNLMVKQVCKRTKYLICNSQNSANLVKRQAYADDDILHILHPGVDAHRFVPAEIDLSFRAKMGWTDKFVILTVGRLQKRKGQDKMIEAMPLILEKHPNALYVIVGNGDCKQKLEDMVLGLSLNQSVQILGDISDAEMIQCYQQCDLFILPNRTINNDIEGFGMVLVEAQACAKPVIAGDSGGTKETMIVGETGSVVDCTCNKVIATEVLNYIGDPERCEQMGQKGRAHVEQNLDWDAHAKLALSRFEQA